MATETPLDLNALWDELPVQADEINLSIQGLPVLKPGQCIAVRPRHAPDRPPRRWHDLWFAVFLNARATEGGTVYLKVAWFYTENQALDYFEGRTFKSMQDEVAKMCTGELMLTTHQEVIELTTLKYFANIPFKDFTNNALPCTYCKLICFDIDDAHKTKIIAADPDNVQIYLGVTIIHLQEEVKQG